MGLSMVNSNLTNVAAISIAANKLTKNVFRKIIKQFLKFQQFTKGIRIYISEFFQNLLKRLFIFRLVSGLHWIHVTIEGADWLNNLLILLLILLLLLLLLTYNNELY